MLEYDKINMPEGIDVNKTLIIMMIMTRVTKSHAGVLFIIFVTFLDNFFSDSKQKHAMVSVI